MKPCSLVVLGCACVLGVSAVATRAADAPPSTYQTPPAPIVRVIDRFAANDVEPHRALLSYDRKRLLVRHAPPFVSIAEHAQPRWRANNETVSILLNQWASFFHAHGAKSLSIVNVSDGREIAAALPADARIRYEEWSPDSRWIACGVFRDGPGEVWVVNAADGGARRLTGPIMNSIGSVPLRWAD